MADQTQGPYILINAFEQTVFNNVRDMIGRQPDMCQCEKCYHDVCALVMNKGFVKFVTTDEGQLLAKLPTMSHEKQVDLMVAIQESIELVKKSPQHQ